MGAYSPVLSGQKSENKDQTIWMKTTEIKPKKNSFFMVPYLFLLPECYSLQTPCSCILKYTMHPAASAANIYAWEKLLHPHTRTHTHIPYVTYSARLPFPEVLLTCWLLVKLNYRFPKITVSTQGGRNACLENPASVTEKPGKCRPNTDVLALLFSRWPKGVYPP